MALGSHGVAQPVLGAQLSSAARPHTWARLALALLSLERQSEWELNMTKSLRWRLLNYALLSLQLKILYSTGFLIYYTAHNHSGVLLALECLRCICAAQMEPVPSKFPYPEGTTLACFPKDSPACYFLSPCPTATRPPSLCCGAMLLVLHCEFPTQPLNICHALQPACKRFLLCSFFFFSFFSLFCLFVFCFRIYEMGGL